MCPWRIASRKWPKQNRERCRKHRTRPKRTDFPSQIVSKDVFFLSLLEFAFSHCVVVVVVVVVVACRCCYYCCYLSLVLLLRLFGVRRLTFSSPRRRLHNLHENHLEKKSLPSPLSSESASRGRQRNGKPAWASGGFRKTGSLPKTAEKLSMFVRQVDS